MQFVSRTDIDAPLANVYADLVDFEGWERAAMRRGAEVTRTDTRHTPGPGLAWAIRFGFRGKMRDVALKLVTMDRAGKIGFAGHGKSLEGQMGLELVALAPNRTRLMLTVDLRPLSLGARLLMQTLKLGRGGIQTKLNKRLTALARDIEARHKVTRSKTAGL